MTPLDKFKDNLKSDIDFILENKEINITTTEKTVELLMPRLRNLSHETWIDGRLIDKYVGHKIRQNQKQELAKFMREYISNKNKDRKLIK